MWLWDGELRRLGFRRKSERYWQCERRFGRFTRQFTLPERVDAAKIAAAVKDGILEITLPKLPEAQPKRIQIETK